MSAKENLNYYSIRLKSEFQFRNLAINRASHSVQRQRGKTAKKISAYSTLHIKFQFLKFLSVLEHNQCILSSFEHTIKCSSSFSLDCLSALCSSGIRASLRGLIWKEVLFVAQKLATVMSQVF